MSTVVVVKKAGVIVIAADTMTKYGSRYESAEHIANSSKITQVGENYFGCVGHASYGLILESYFRRFKTPPKLTGVQDVFEMARTLHLALKDEYYLNPTEDSDDPFESLQAQCLIANP